jgi:DNA-binding beta-propeller fold protein YncE
MEKNELESKVKAKQQVIDDVVAKLTSGEKSEYEKRMRTYLYAMQNKNAANIERNESKKEINLYTDKRVREVVIGAVVVMIFSTLNYLFEFISEDKFRQFATASIFFGAFYLFEMKFKEVQQQVRDSQLKDKVEFYEFEINKIGKFMSHYRHAVTAEWVDKKFEDYDALQTEDSVADYCIEILESMCVAGGLQYKAKQIME